MRLPFLVAAVALSAVALVTGAAVRRVRAAASPQVALAGAPLRLYSENAHGYVRLPTVVKTDAEWKALLSPEEFRVTRRQGTERAFSGAYWNEHRHGVYRCVACGTDVFRSEAKYDSGTGWPSFWEPIAPENIETRLDRSLFMVRQEVLCRRCGAHLGHVFSDGPRPTGLRYCMNSAALQFLPQP